MLTVCCVKWGKKYPVEYVTKLEAMVKRNLSVAHEFVCFTDDPGSVKCKARKLPPGLDGWWNKIYLFKRGLFEGRVLFLDLDVVITGSLDELVSVQSRFCTISDWHLPGYNSSVFVMDKDSHPEIWDDFDKTVMDVFNGDQDWITEKIRNAAVFPSQWCVSYRSHAVPGIPKGAKVVVFHGYPKPKDCPSEWIKEHWTD